MHDYLERLDDLRKRLAELTQPPAATTYADREHDESQLVGGAS